MVRAHSYTASIQAKLIHTPIASTRSENNKDFSNTVQRDDIVESELVAAVTNMGKHAKFHLTIPIEEKKSLTIKQGVIQTSF